MTLKYDGFCRISQPLEVNGLLRLAHVSEAEKIDKTIEVIRATNESDKLDAEDLKNG